MPKVVDYQEQRQKIATAACKAIVRKGVGKVRMVDVAAEAGVTTGMILNYFENKDAILAEALRVPFQNTVSRIRILLEGGNADLHTLLEPCIPITDELFDDNAVWVSFWGAMISDDKLIALNKELHLEGIQLVKHAITSAWPETEHWPAQLLEDVRRSISTVLFGLSTGGVTNPADWSPDAQRKQLKIQLHMLRAWANNEHPRDTG